MTVFVTVAQDELEKLINKKLALVMSDGSKFRGTLTNFDDQTLVLEDVLELSERLKWIKPVISTAESTEITSVDGISERQERGYLPRVIIYLSHVSRIWPWEPKALA